MWGVQGEGYMWGKGSCFTVTCMHIYNAFISVTNADSVD